MQLSFFDALSVCAGADLPKNAEPLAGMNYTEELDLKRRAFEMFCRSNLMKEVKPASPVPAILPRKYRANSKRKAEFNRGKFKLMNMDSTLAGVSALEPDSHKELYDLISRTFAAKPYHVLAGHVNFCIIRGAGAYQALVLNVDRFDSKVIHAAKNFANVLKKESPKTGAFFLYLDESDSKYYLESKRPEGRMGIKKMFGPENLSVKLDNLKLMYPPVVFSQVNEAMLPMFARIAREMLKPEKNDILLDLYCGYGLLGLSMADAVKSVIGVEIDGPAVKAASANASFLFKQKNMRFVKGEISPALLRTKLPARDIERNELIVLDPPRMGTAGGVIRELAKRTPERVLHIVCGTDEIPREVAEWKKYGYQLKQIRPVDMFPGTAGLETFLLFEPKTTENTKD